MTDEVKPCDRCGDPGGFVDRGRDRPRRRRMDWSDGGVRRSGSVCARCCLQICRARSATAFGVARRLPANYSADVDGQVLAACRRLIERRVYPSVVRIQRELPVSLGCGTILEARRRAFEGGHLGEISLDRGQFVVAIRAITGRPRTYNSPEPTAEEIEANARAEREAFLASTRDEAPAIPALVGRTLLDAFASRQLDALAPADVSRILRRRFRKARAGGRQIACA